MGQAKDVVFRFFEYFADGKMADAGELFDDVCVSIMPGGALDKSQHEEMGRAFKAGLPDSRMEVDHVVEAGEEVVVLGHFRGTHTGDLQSSGGVLPHSGRLLNLRFIDYFRVENGKIVDHQTAFDQLEMVSQLTPAP